jgi:uncharacterized membrane protein
VAPALLAFGISFYIVASYWGTHRRLMRRVTAINPRLVRNTMTVLLLVAAMPFPATVLADLAVWHRALPSMAPTT